MLTVDAGTNISFFDQWEAKTISIAALSAFGEDVESGFSEKARRATSFYGNDLLSC
jgi:hypothetical protein